MISLFPNKEGKRMEISLPSEELRLRLGSSGIVICTVAITFNVSINYDTIFRTNFFF